MFYRLIFAFHRLKNWFAANSFVEIISCNTIDLPPDNDEQPAMFADYPDVVGVPELMQMLGGISAELACREMREKIEHLRIGREYKTTKYDVIAYIYNNKK
jgi:hypothetical protein